VTVFPQRINGTSASLASLQITAAWSPTVVTPTRLVRNWGASGLDVALIFLGQGDFGDRPMLLISHAGLEDGSKVRKFGRGIDEYATAGPPPTAATFDGLYRSADFTASSVGVITYTLKANEAGRKEVGEGGDSGGPDWTISNGNLLAIAGVQSTCTPTGRVAGMLPANSWIWVTGISSCDSAPIWQIDYDVKEIVRPERVAFCQEYAAKAVAAANENRFDGCQFGGGRWTTDAAAHLDWCMSLNGNRKPPDTETEARETALKLCRYGKNRAAEEKPEDRGAIDAEVRGAGDLSPIKIRDVDKKFRQGVKLSPIKTPNP
jgi:hypothetical protein